MNRKSLGLLAPQAVTGFLQYKTAEALSPNTLISYESVLKLWLSHIGNVDLSTINSASVLEFLAWLRTDYTPRRFDGSDTPLSPKSIRNVSAVLSAFFRWAHAEFDFPNPMLKVPSTHFQKPPIEAFKKEEIEALLKACEYTQEATTDQRKKFMMKRATAKRDRALVLFLLDTGLRASELCALRIGDVEQKTGRVEIKHGVKGGAKGGKGRIKKIG